MRNPTAVYQARQQCGSALIISLVLLLLLMLTAVAGISSSIVQERMAHNTSQLNERFQAAESGLRYVEQQVRAHALVLPAHPCVPADCDVQAQILGSTHAGMTPGGDWRAVPAAVVGTDTQVWYRVVRLGDSTLSATLAAGSVSTLYRVSVISQRNTTRTLLEGVYAYSRI